MMVMTKDAKDAQVRNEQAVPPDETIKGRDMELCT